MFRWIKEKTCGAVNHKVLHGAMAVVYTAGALGADKALVYGAAALAYAVLVAVD